MTRLCDVLGLSTSGDCAWLKRVPSQRARADDALSRRIGTIHEASRGTYGWAGSCSWRSSWTPSLRGNRPSIVGWSMATHLRTSLVLGVLEMAVQQRQPDAVIHHSDQGCQYTSIEFGLRCGAAGVRPSTGSVGDCYDNAMCESFFATLECELLDQIGVVAKARAKMEVFSFIEGGYNPRRRHAALGHRSPVDVEKLHSAVLEAA